MMPLESSVRVTTERGILTFEADPCSGSGSRGIYNPAVGTVGAAFCSRGNRRVVIP